MIPNIIVRITITPIGATIVVVADAFTDERKIAVNSLKEYKTNPIKNDNTIEIPVRIIERVRFNLKFLPLSILIMLARNHVPIAKSNMYIDNIIDNVTIGLFIPALFNALPGIYIITLVDKIKE